MSIAIIGAFEFVGSALVNEAIRRGHTITAIAWSTEKIPTGNDMVTPRSVDVNDVDKLTAPVKRQTFIQPSHRLKLLIFEYNCL